MFSLLIFTLVTLVLLYQAVTAFTWALVLGVFVVCASWLFSTPALLLILYWLLLLAVVALAFFPRFRQQWCIPRIMAWYQSVLPTLSDTEQQALDAGDVSWDGELFSGNPDWYRLNRIPKPLLTDAEQTFLDGATEQLCAQLNDWRITHETLDLPPSVWQFMREQRFFGMVIPKEYGGLGFSAQAHSQVVMKIATRSITAAVTVMVPNSLGPGELLVHYGTQRQRDAYLPKLASGELLPCFALTGPEAGSDAGALTDSGIVSYGEWQGQKVLGLTLNWEKRYITLAPVASLLGLAFKVYDPDGLLGEQKELGVTCALIATDLPGIRIGSRHLPIGAVFMNGPTWGKDVFIPLEQVIGEREGIGQGWRMLMNCLSIGRSISLPALSTGAGKLATLTTGAYARVRQQFKVPLAKFEGVQEALAKIAGLTYLMNAGRTLTAALVDQGLKPAVPSAMLKYHNTELMRIVINSAMDVHAGRGVITGPHNYLASLYAAIPISITVEGANILTRSLMIFGQGGVRCHPFILKEMQALKLPQAEAQLEFDRVFCQHVATDLQMAARSFLLALTQGKLTRAPQVAAVLKPYYQQLSRFSASFYLAAEVTMGLLGGKLKFKERTSARLADIFSYLYLGSAVLKQFQDQGCPKADEPLLHYAMQYCLWQIQQALDVLLSNYPKPFIGPLLRILILPLGQCLKPPADALQQAITDAITQNGDVRDRLTAGVYRPLYSQDPLAQDPLATVEHAFELLLSNSPEAEQAVWDAIQVDDFTREQFSKWTDKE
jgi:acyl-CoA dehydrogenase